MFLKLFSANLRSATSVCNLVYARTSQSFVTPINKCANLNLYTKLQYTTDKAASSTSKHSDKTAVNELSHDEIQMLKQNPDDFGTLLSLAPSDTLKQPQQSDEIVKEKTGRRSSKRQSIEQYQTLLKKLINEKRTDEAVELLEGKMMKDKLLIPIDIYEWLIEECLQCRNYAKVLNLFEHMVNRSLKISTKTLEKITQSFEMSELPIRKAINLRKFISKGKCQPTEKIYNALVRIHIRGGQWQSGIEVADEMKQHNFQYEHETLYFLFIGYSHDKVHGFYRMLDLWHEMYRLNYKPDVYIINALFKCVLNCEFDDVGKLQEILDSIEANNRIAKEGVSSKIYENAEKVHVIDEGRPNLLDVPPKIGRLFPIENMKTPEHRFLVLGGLSFFLKLLKKHDILPTSDTITILLHLAPNTFVAQQKVIALLRKTNIVPDADFFDALLTKCCLRQSFNDAQEVIELMRTYEMQVDLVTYGLLSMSCKTANDASQFFDEIDIRHTALNIDILNAMLKNACREEDNDFVISILRKMISKEIEPTEETFHMVKNYQRDILRKLRYERSHNHKTRNECFKLTRECRQWLKRFRLDKDETEKKSNSIDTKSKISNSQPKRNKVKQDESTMEKEDQSDWHINHT